MFMLEESFMLRALQIAKCGLGAVSPNPMVGAVIVSAEGRIIGEGFHRVFGGPHAEVNAINDVASKDENLLKSSTIYVTLEPCSHQGKTPPCVDLLLKTGFKRVVIGTTDPFDKVAGRGIQILRDNGIEVVTGILEKECRSLNARFLTAHTQKRPFIILKWAQSIDGYMDHKRGFKENAARFSDELGLTLVHRLRSHNDSIGVGSGTYLSDSPKLNVRYWDGSDPKKIIFDRRGRVSEKTAEIKEHLSFLYNEGITSLLIEGGPTLLNSFISLGLWDLGRVEISPIDLKERGMVKAPVFNIPPFDFVEVGKNRVNFFSNNPLVSNFFIENAL